MSTNNGDDSSSDDNTGIIALIVIGIVIFIILHIILAIVIIWCIFKRKGRSPTISETPKPVISSSDKQLQLDKNQENKLDLTSNNDMPLDSKGYETLRLSPLVSPSKFKDRPKLTCKDYEAMEETADYEEALHTYANISNLPLAEHLSTTEYDEVPSNDITDEEEVFIDPGHCEADICAFFKKRCFINQNDVSILKVLGSGEFGTVHLGLWSNGSTDPVQVAVKTLNSQCSESDRVKFLREAAIMDQFEFNYIIRLYGIVLEEQNIMIVLEYMSQGDLHNYLIDLKNKKSIEDLTEFKHDLLSFCRHVAAGLGHLSQKQFVHRDLAARNILVSSDDVCKIADFGMARDVADDTYYKVSGGKIPVKWTAPEAIFYKKYSVQSDVWSLGCVMYEIWSMGHKPFEDDNAIGCLKKISAGYRLPPPPGCPRAIYELMIQCWNPQANQRITACNASRTLQKSDRILLPVNDEEQTAKLGDSLSKSCELYLDLQNMYKC